MTFIVSIERLDATLFGWAPVSFIRTALRLGDMKPEKKIAWKTREFVFEDVDRLVRLVNGAYRGESGRQGWTTEADIIGGQRTDPKSILETVARPGSVILVAHGEGNPELIMGCVHVERTKQFCYLGMLTVDVALQKGGLGKFLLEAAERYAKTEFDSAAIEMTVITSRRELIEWYERRGYRRTGEKKPFPYGDERFGLPFVAGLEFEVLRKSL